MAADEPLRIKGYVEAGHIIPGARTAWEGGDAMESDLFGTHAVRGPAPVMASNRVTLGYDKSQFPLLCQHVLAASEAENTEKLLNALGVVRRSLSPATKVAEAATAGLLDVLLSLVDYGASDRARELATDAVLTMLTHSAGRAQVIACAKEAEVAGRLRRLARLTADSSQRVRLSALRALNAVAGAQPGPAVLSGAEGVVAAVAEAVARESAGRSVAAAEAEAEALACLARCAQSHDREGVVRCLACSVPEVAVTALARGRGRSTAEAARLLTALATPAHGKDAVLAAGATMSACEAVSALREGAAAAAAAGAGDARGRGSSDERTVADGLGASMALLGMLCIDTGAKRHAFDAGAVDAVVGVLREWRHQAVLVHACRAVEVLTELPEARAALLAAGADTALLDVRDGPRTRDAVVRAADDAHKAVTWKP